MSVSSLSILRDNLCQWACPENSISAAWDLAVGYLQRPELTPNRSSPGVWVASAAQRFYRTGDLARLFAGQ